MQQALQEIKRPSAFLFSPLDKFLLGIFGDTGYTWPMYASGLREEVNHLNKFFLEGFWASHRSKTLICKCDVPSSSLQTEPCLAAFCLLTLLWARFSMVPKVVYVPKCPSIPLTFLFSSESCCLLESGRVMSSDDCTVMLRSWQSLPTLLCYLYFKR